MMGGCCGWGGWWGFGSFGWLGMFFSLIFWLLIIVAVVWGVRWLLQSTSMPGSATSSSPAPAGEDPKRVLQLRYARGEITREEYLKMLADLEGKSA